MKKHKTEKKLSLAQHTVAVLADTRLETVVGARPNLSNLTLCKTCVLSDFC
ncbi:MAG: class I lanthipeptide [Deltaproteobacteria bacterium]|nr:class I lanthipeptide [Deltaproteobacteria bacterium]